MAKTTTTDTTMTETVPAAHRSGDRSTPGGA